MMPEESNAAIIRKYTRELLEDRQPHTGSEIRKYITKKLNGKSYGDGIFYGGIRALWEQESKTYKKVCRGVYIKKPQLLSNSYPVKHSSFSVIPQTIKSISHSTKVFIKKIKEDKYDIAINQFIKEIKSLGVIDDITSITIEDFKLEKCKLNFILNGLENLIGDNYKKNIQT